MTVMIQLPNEQERKLAERASASGFSVEQYVEKLIDLDLRQPPEIVPVERPETGPTDDTPEVDEATYNYQSVPPKTVASLTVSHIPHDSGTTIPNGTSLPLDAPELELDENEYEPRGTLTISVQRRVIAEDSSPIEFTRLPRWKPTISLDQHWLEDADE